MLYRPTAESRLPANNANPLLHNSILALAARACNFAVKETFKAPFNNVALGALFFNRARYHLMRSGFQSSLESLQGLIFMSLRENGCGRTAQAWREFPLVCTKFMSKGDDNIRLQNTQVSSIKFER